MDDLRAIVIGRTDEMNAVRLGDLAHVFIGLQEYRGQTQVSVAGAPFQPAITMSVLKRPGQDTLATIERVEAHIATLVQDPDWPQRVAVTVLRDEGELIRVSFNEVQSNLVQGVVTVKARLAADATAGAGRSGGPWSGGPWSVGPAAPDPHHLDHDHSGVDAARPVLALLVSALYGDHFGIVGGDCLCADRDPGFVHSVGRGAPRPPSHLLARSTMRRWPVRRGACASSPSYGT